MKVKIIYENEFGQNELAKALTIHQYIEKTYPDVKVIIGMVSDDD